MPVEQVRTLQGREAKTLMATAQQGLALLSAIAGELPDCPSRGSSVSQALQRLFVLSDPQAACHATRHAGAARLLHRSQPWHETCCRSMVPRQLSCQSMCLRQDQVDRIGGGPLLITATQGVTSTSLCPACGGVLVLDVGQFIEWGQLRWGIEGRCHACAHGWCEMGAGPTPEEVRQALLTQHGSTRLRLAAETDLVPVMRALHEMRHLRLGEARLTAAELSGPGLVGTSAKSCIWQKGFAGGPSLRPLIRRPPDRPPSTQLVDRRHWESTRRAAPYPIMKFRKCKPKSDAQNGPYSRRTRQAGYGWTLDRPGGP